MDLIALFEDYVPPALVEEEGDSFDLFDELFGDFMEEDDYRSYLHRDSVIFSLVREKKSKTVTIDTEFKRFLDAMNYEKLVAIKGLYKQQAKVLSACHRYVVAPMLKLTEDVINNNGVVWPSEEQFKEFHRYFPADEFTISRTSWLEHKLVSVCMEDKSEPATIKLSFQRQNENFQALLPLDGRLRRNYCWTSRKLRDIQMPYIAMIDGTCLSKRAFVQVAKMLFHEYLDGRALNEVREDAVIGETLWFIKKALIRSGAISGDIMTIDVNVCNKYSHDIPDLMRAIFGCEVVVRPCGVVEGLREGNLPYLYFFLDSMETGLDTSHLTVQLEVAFAFFMRLLRKMHEEKRHEIYERNLAESAARVYETKRNIPDKYLKAMAASRLNDVFGYVEIDADCDLQRIREIEKEFLGFKQEYFRERVFKDHAIRFRKLGRYHASGLYIPDLGCLCIDIRTPGSFIHEYLHMIDQAVEGEELSHSSRYSFSAIKERYEKVLGDWINMQPPSDKDVAVLKGKTKYNLAYYLEPTEIFARCGEMYFKRIVGVNSSLLAYGSRFAYPADEKLMELVKEYYDSLFGISSAEEGMYEAAVS